MSKGCIKTTQMESQEDKKLYICKNFQQISKLWKASFLCLQAGFFAINEYARHVEKNLKKESFISKKWNLQACWEQRHEKIDPKSLWNVSCLLLSSNPTRKYSKMPWFLNSLISIHMHKKMDVEKTRRPSSPNGLIKAAWLCCLGRNGPLYWNTDFVRIHLTNKISKWCKKIVWKDF